jgi:hypothetical protein
MFATEQSLLRSGSDGAPATWYHHHSDRQGYQRSEEAAKFRHQPPVAALIGAVPGSPADHVDTRSAIMRYDVCS